MESEEATQPLAELAADRLAVGAASVASLLVHTAAHMEPATADTQFARLVRKARQTHFAPGTTSVGSVTRQWN